MASNAGGTGSPPSQDGGSNGENQTSGSPQQSNQSTGQKASSNEFSKNRRNKNRGKNKKYLGNRKNGKPKNKSSTFKGTVSEMNGHVFQCQNEGPTGNQFLRTVEELRSYVSIQMSKYPHDIIYVLKHMEECPINKPPPPAKDADRTDTRIWEKEVDKYVDRKEYYKQNKSSLYAIIWTQCSLPMQAQLKSLNEYNDIHKNDNCLALLQSIRAISMKFESHDYLYKAMYVATKKFYNYRQGQYETEAEYMANFKDLIEAIIYYGGSLGEDPILVRAELVELGNDMDSYEKISESTRQKLNLNLEPGSSEHKDASSAARDKFFAMAFLMSSDPRRYKNLLTELDNDHSKGTGNYPTTLTAAYSLLVNYRAQTFQKSRPISDNDDGSEDDVSFLNTPGAFVPTCHICGKKGHIAPKCPEKNKNTPPPSNTPTGTPTTDAVQLLMNAVEESQSSGLDFSFNSNLGSQSNHYFHSNNVCLNVLSTQVFQPITTSQQIILKMVVMSIRIGYSSIHNPLSTYLVTANCYGQFEKQMDTHYVVIAMVVFRIQL